MDAADLLNLLGNANRRRILGLIARRPRYVTELEDRLGLSPKTVIGHLRKLETAGVIESRTGRSGRKYFSIAEPLRLEVTLTPYEFSVKRSYPRPGTDRDTAETEGSSPTTADLGALLDRRRELSIARRQLEGRLTAVLESLADRYDLDRPSLAVLLAVARGASTHRQIERRVGAPPDELARTLRRLTDVGLIERGPDGWTLTDREE